jgi:large subunit ribosomal protein L30
LEEEMSKAIAIVRIRGKTNLTKKINDTLAMLRLFRQNGCVVVPSTPAYVGMIKKAKDYITWGEVDEETMAMLLEKRAKVAGNKPLTEAYLKEKTKMSLKSFAVELAKGTKSLKEVPGIKPYFRLMPPAKGFERQGIKKPFSMGGALGYRKENINKLIQRMM